MATKATKLDKTVLLILASRIIALAQKHNEQTEIDHKDEMEFYWKSVRARGEKVVKRWGKNFPIEWGNDALPRLLISEEVRKEILGKPPICKQTRVVFLALEDKYAYPLQISVHGDASRFEQLAKTMEDKILSGDTTGLGSLLDSF